MSEHDQAPKPGQGSSQDADENKLIAERRGKLAELRNQVTPFHKDIRRQALADHYPGCLT